MDEKKLIKGLKKGDNNAYRFLVSRFGKKIYRLVIGIVKDPTEAEEITQEVFVRVFQKVKSFRGDSALSTWLFRVAFNTALLHLRKRKNRKDTAPLSEYTNVEEESRYVEEITAEDMMEKRERNEVVMKALQLLPPSYKIALILKDIEGLSVEEVAKTLKLTKGGTKARIHRGRLMLKRKIEEIRGESFFK